MVLLPDGELLPEGELVPDATLPDGGLLVEPDGGELGRAAVEPDGDEVPELADFSRGWLVAASRQWVAAEMPLVALEPLGGLEVDCADAASTPPATSAALSNRVLVMRNSLSSPRRPAR